MRVSLIVTGELERVGLAASLSRVFPGATFSVDMKLDSFTSARVQNLGVTKTRGLIDKLAAALVAAVDPGRAGKAADLAIAVEDLEILNLDQPGAVVNTFCDAVDRHLIEHWPSQARQDQARKRVREHASFHLLSPMIEAYFFANPAWLAAAGVSSPPLLAPGVDLEEFTVIDPTYLAAPVVVGAGSWAVARRDRHPKHYVQFLLDPSIPPTQKYREKLDGKAALDCVDWGALTAAHASHGSLVRSMLADLAFGLSLPGSRFPGTRHVATSQSPRVLRNA